MVSGINEMELHTEELILNGLTLTFFVRTDAATKNYIVTCKAFDQHRNLLWQTELLDPQGKPLMFHSLAAAVTKTRTTFAIYKKEKAPAI